MINHVFRAEVNNRIPQLLKNVKTLDAFIASLKRMNEEVTTADFCGHGFQALTEAIIAYKKLLTFYEVIATCEHDLKVHGKGVNKNGNPTTVFNVYVKKPCMLTAGYGITAFAANSMSHYHIDPKQKEVMYLFSNAVGVHERTVEQFVTGLNLGETFSIWMYDDIKALIDNDDAFWSFFAEELKLTIAPVQKKEMREHQVKAFEACKSNKKGQIILPTGTGKSLIAASVIEDCVNDNKEAVCVIASPRIVLTYQLLGTVADHLFARKIDARYVNLNSGQMDDDMIKKAMVGSGLIPRDITSTTSPTELKTAYNESWALGIPFIIGATYQSVIKLMDSGIPITLLICDEAHNLVMGRFSEDIKKKVHDLPAERKYSFTATQAFTADEDEGMGMENKALFGEVLFSVSPRKMMEAGEIVPPYIHQVNIDQYKIQQTKNSMPVIGDMDDIEHNVEIAACVVIEAFKQHKLKVKEKSCSPDSIGAKMLVVCKGEQSLSALLNDSQVMLKFKLDNPKVRLFGISSTSGAYLDSEIITPNGGKYKDLFMMELRFLKDEEDAIIFHIDMIGEGIDVPGITGVMAFRDLGTIKSCQTLGRAMRLCAIDRAKLYSGEIKGLEWSKMVKPFAWVIVPVYSWEQQDSKARVIEIAQKMREELGYIPIEDFNNSPADGRIEPVRKDNQMGGKAPTEMDLIHLIEEPDFLAAMDGIIEDSIKDDNLLKVRSKSIKTRYIGGEDIFVLLAQSDKEKAEKKSLSAGK